MFARHRQRLLPGLDGFLFAAEPVQQAAQMDQGGQAAAELNGALLGRQRVVEAVQLIEKPAMHVVVQNPPVAEGDRGGATG